MKGVWEDLPASPCSAASDDTAMRSTRHAALKATGPTKHFVPMPQSSTVSIDLSAGHPSPPIAKRARIEPVVPDLSTNIAFAEAKTSNAESDAALVSKLNISAEDERRKALLQRLQAIDARKAQLRSSPCDDDEVICVEEKSTAARRATRAVPATKPVAARRSRKRRAASSRQPSGTTKGPAKAIAQQVIDVDADCASIVPAAVGTKSSAKATTAPKAKKGEPAAPKRVSTRVRRPRNPNGITDNAASTKTVAMPACMSKCKQLQFCKKLTNTMLRNSSAAPFSAPVNELWPAQAIPRYFDVISRPMDLRTVKKNLETTIYLCSTPGDYLPYRFEVDRFAEDVRLVFRNAMVYNKVGDMLYNCASALLKDFEKSLGEELPQPPSPEEIAACLSKKRSTSGRAKKERGPSHSSRKLDVVDAEVVCLTEDPAPVASATSRGARRKLSSRPKEVSGEDEFEYLSEKEMRTRLRYLQDCRVPVIARTPVPKGSGYLSRAALLYDVDMTWQEKKRCSENFDKVPSSKLEALISMIKKSSGYVESDKPEEFEFDMDSLDNKAMRNIEAFLEQFVPGFKTVRSSTLGREFSTVAEVDEEISRIRKRLARIPKPVRQEKKPTRIADRPKSFFEAAAAANDSSSDSSSGEESDGDSDSSDDSDCE